MALIEYIGKQVNRKDDVLQTSRRWMKAGDVQTVPDVEKDFYLAHPGEWRETTPELLKIREDARQIANASLEMLRGVWANLHLAELKEAAAELATEIERRTVEEREDAINAKRFHVEKAKEQFAKVEVGLADVAIPDIDSEAGQDRQRKIKLAIAELDRKDPEHYTKAGVPRVPAVREVVGFDVTAEEIAAAYTGTEE